MSLTKKDKEDIGQIIKEQVTEIVDEKVSGFEVKMNQGLGLLRTEMSQGLGSLATKMNQEFGLLRLEMNQRFDEASMENKSEHREIIQKIEEVKQMETEDVQVLYKDVAFLKKKIAV